MEQILKRVVTKTTAPVTHYLGKFMNIQLKNIATVREMHLCFQTLLQLHFGKTMKKVFSLVYVTQIKEFGNCESSVQFGLFLIKVAHQ